MILAYLLLAGICVAMLGVACVADASRAPVVVSAPQALAVAPPAQTVQVSTLVTYGPQDAMPVVNLDEVPVELVEIGGQYWPVPPGGVDVKKWPWNPYAIQPVLRGDETVVSASTADPALTLATNDPVAPTPDAPAFGGPPQTPDQQSAMGAHGMPT